MRIRSWLGGALLVGATGCAMPAAIQLAEVPVEGPVPLRDRYARGRLIVLAEVNADRVAADLRPVALDSLATVVAQSHADAMARGLYLSHYEADGSGPQDRYARAGGTAHVRENVFRWDPRQENPRQNVFGWRRFDVRRAEAWFMGSPPHRATILDPSRTHLGVGIAEDDAGSIYVVQEFLAAHARIEDAGPPWRGETTVVRGSVVRPRTRPLLVYLVRVGKTVGEPMSAPPAGLYEDGGPDGEIVPPWRIEWDAATGTFGVPVDVAPLEEGARWYGIVYVAPRDTVERAVESRVVNSNEAMAGAAFFVGGHRGSGSVAGHVERP